ncbi:MAG: hypothetical protein M0R05_05580 [Bacilli bacterium]|nr:hypothetical protein [Bacilli bacterium]
MKKKYLFISLLAISGIIVVFIMMRAKMPSTVTVSTIPKAYNCVSLIGEDDSITFEIFADTKKSFIGEAENITETYLANEEGERLKLKITAIELASDEIIINKKRYHLFYFTFKIDFYPATQFSFEIDSALLTINYRSDAMIQINIGSFSYYKFTSFVTAFLSVGKLKGLVNEIDGCKTLAAVEIGLSNNTECDLIITEIIPLDLNVAFSSSDRILSIDLNYRFDDEIELLLGYPYQFTPPGSSVFTYRLAAGEKVNFLIPLKYYRLLALNKLGFIIEYTVGGNAYQLIYDDFTFFNTRELSHKTLEALVLYTYENH